MAVLGALIAAATFVAPLLASGTPWQGVPVKAQIPGRTPVFRPPPLGSGNPWEHRPLVIPQIQGALPFQQRSSVARVATREASAPVMAPESTGNAPKPGRSSSNALEYCPGDDNAKCDFDTDHRICAQLLDTEGKPLNWGDNDISSDLHWNGGASKCINMSVTASLVQKVGCENVKISCEATDLGYVTARNWWAYASWGQSIAPAVNCLNELCNPNLATGRSDNFLGDWDWNGAANDAFLSNPSDALTSRDPREIDVAYKQCEDVTKTFSKTFYIGTAFMAPAERKHAWAIYAWCRRTDDIVDSPHAQLNPTVLDRDLEEWNRRLDLIWDHRSMDMFDLAMADTVRAYPTMDIQPYRDMIKGMIMDVPGHPEGKRRYETFEELYTYCYRVAGTVGMMMLPILGAAPEFTEEQAKKPAVALGIALQLTNILRDVGEDLKRGRIYLPQEDLRAFGITQKELLAGKVTDKYRNFVKFQIARARGYYKEAAKGIPMLAPDARFAVRASLDLYGRILDKIEENDYDNFNKRAFTTGLEKLSILPGSWMKSLQKPEKVQDSAVCNDPMCKDPLMKQVQLVSSPQNSTSWSEGSMSMAVAGFAAGAVVAFAVALRRRRPTGSEVALLG